MTTGPALAAMLPGRSLPPGVAVCLRRCGWTPPTGTDIAAAAIGHRDATAHPVVFRTNRSTQTSGGDGTARRLEE